MGFLLSNVSWESAVRISLSFSSDSLTGTLDSLSDAERAIVSEKYRVTKYTFNPSMYGKSKLQFKPVGDVIMETDVDRYYQTIYKDIVDEREKGRAVLVYFEDETKINEFLGSSYGSQLVDNFRIVTEKTDNISFYVEWATQSGRVTFFPRVFARGLDFICRDAAVDHAGGVHVIQAFFSETPSEEEQIQGRVARQSKKGSSKIILLMAQLMKQLQMTEEELMALDRTDRFYSTLHAKRLELLTKSVEAQIVKTKKLKELHEKSFRFMETLRSNQATEAELVNEILSFGR
jgi:preprotein translocase subunit SecA